MVVIRGSRKSRKQSRRKRGGADMFKHSNTMVSNFYVDYPNNSFGNNMVLCKTMKECQKYGKEDIIYELRNRGILFNAKSSKLVLIKKLLMDNRKMYY
jgi:hypothetical protein